MFTPEDYTIAIRDRPKTTEIKLEVREALACYYGNAEVKQFVRKYSRLEEEQKLELRREQTFYFYENYVAEVCTTYIEGIYRTNKVVRKSDIAELDEYFANEYDVKWQSDIAPLLLILGEPFVFVEWDTDKDDMPATFAEQRERKIWPRPRMVLPNFITNYEVLNGKLDWVSQKMERKFPDKRFNTGERVDIYYRVLDEANIYELSEAGKLLSSTPHGFNSIPVVWNPWKIEHNVDEDYRTLKGYAFMYPVIKKSIAALQVTSMLVEASYQSMFPLLKMSEATADEAKMHGLGAGTPAIEKAETPEQELKYVTKPDSEVQFLSHWLYEVFPDNIRRAARLRNLSNDNATSGISKKISGVPELAALQGIANYIQYYDQQVMQLVADGYNGSPVDIECKYPSRFDLKGADELLDEIKSMSLSMFQGFDYWPPTLIVGTLRQLFYALVADPTPAEEKALESELDDILAALNEPPDDPPEEFNDKKILVTAGTGSQSGSDPADIQQITDVATGR